MKQNLTVQEAEDHYQELKARGSQLDLTRGKPSSEQLDLSLDLENLSIGNFIEDGINRHLDIIETTPGEWPFAVLYFTGSGGFNIKMRRHALSMGYTMNEYSLKNKSTWLYFYSESKKMCLAH